MGYSPAELAVPEGQSVLDMAALADMAGGAVVAAVAFAIDLGRFRNRSLRKASFAREAGERVVVQSTEDCTGELHPAGHAAAEQQLTPTMPSSLPGLAAQEEALAEAEAEALDMPEQMGFCS
jgi:hypothetical protein